MTLFTMRRIRRPKPSKRQSRRRVYFEQAEPRSMLSVVTVNTDQDIVDPGDELTSLREAIEIANDLRGADEVVFDFGHDRPETILLEDGELILTDAVRITGPGAQLLTIDAQHLSRIFNITAKEGDFVIEGLRLTAGRGIGSEPQAPWIDKSDHVGGAIRSDTSGLLTLRNSEISNSEVVEWGDGAAMSAAGNVAIESCTISGNSRNSRTYHSGTILARGDITVGFSTFKDNSGGISTDGDVMVVSTEILRNGEPRGIFIHSGWGDGAINADGDVAVHSSVISENESLGIYSDGSVTIRASTISENRGGYFTAEFPPSHVAGGIAARGNVAVWSSTISGNTEGGIKARGSVMIHSSTIAGNHTTPVDFGTTRRAGVTFLGDLILENSIVADNNGGDLEFLIRDPGDFCGLRNDCPDEERTPEWIVRHSLIGNNFGTPLIEAPLGHPDSRGNLIGGPVGGPIDPRLRPLSDNGGPTLTHALLPDSPAINMGDPTAIVGLDGYPRYDQRGGPYSRILVGRIDMGAVESRPLGDANGDGLFDSSDLIKVFQAGKYEDDIDNNANFDEGDWNGDGDFDTSDFVLAFQAGYYVTAATPIAAVVDQLFDGDRDQLREKPAVSLDVFDLEFTKTELF